MYTDVRVTDKLIFASVHGSPDYHIAEIHGVRILPSRFSFSYACWEAFKDECKEYEDNKAARLKALAKL